MPFLLDFSFLISMVYQKFDQLLSRIKAITIIKKRFLVIKEYEEYVFHLTGNFFLIGGNEPKRRAQLNRLYLSDFLIVLFDPRARCVIILNVELAE